MTSKYYINNNNDICNHHWNIQTPLTETFTTKSGLAPSIMRSMFKRRNTIYNPIFKILKQKEKITLYFGLQDTYKLSDFLQSFVNDLTCQKNLKIKCCSVKSQVISTGVAFFNLDLLFNIFTVVRYRLVFWWLLNVFTAST